MLPLLLALLPAHADVVALPPDDQRHITHVLRVEGLDQHAGFTLLAIDDDAKVSAHRVFTAGEPIQELARGGNNRGGGLSQPRLVLLPDAAFAAWSTETQAEIGRQREACAERGEGCAHISRFVPRYAPPKGAIDCGHAVTLQRTAPEDSPGTRLDTVKLVTASATACSVQAVPTASADAPTEAKPPAPVEAGEAAPPTPSAPPAAADAPAEDPPGCATTAAWTSGLSWGAGVLLLGALLGRRRADTPG